MSYVAFFDALGAEMQKSGTKFYVWPNPLVINMLAMLYGNTMAMCHEPWH